LNNFKSKQNARASKAFDIVMALSLKEDYASESPDGECCMQWVILAYNLHIANVKKSTKK
jgi:hypothetical protein